MSLGHGASVVRSGLVLQLDAANRKSYPGSGITWTDLSTQGNSGTLTNGVAYSTANQGVMTFDGTNDYVECGAMPVLNNSLTGLTVAVWHKTQTRSSGMIAENGNSFNTNTFYIAQEDTNNLSFLIANDAGLYQRIYGSTFYALNTWYYFVGTWSSGANVKAYLNGVDTSQQLLSPFGALTSVRSGNTNLNIGVRPGGSLPYSGQIANFSIYTRSLSAVEIQQNFNALRGRYNI